MCCRCCSRRTSGTSADHLHALTGEVGAASGPTDETVTGRSGDEPDGPLARNQDQDKELVACANALATQSWLRPESRRASCRFPVSMRVPSDAFGPGASPGLNRSRRSLGPQVSSAPSAFRRMRTRVPFGASSSCASTSLAAAIGCRTSRRTGLILRNLLVAPAGHVVRWRSTWCSSSSTTRSGRDEVYP